MNGALGIIHEIVYEDGTKPPDGIPFCILAQLDSFAGQSCADDVPRVGPIFSRRVKFLVGASDYMKNTISIIIVMKDDCVQVSIQLLTSHSLLTVFRCSQGLRVSH